MNILSVFFSIVALVIVISGIRFFAYCKAGNHRVDSRLDNVTGRHMSERGSADLGVMILLAVILIIAWGFIKTVKSVHGLSDDTFVYSADMQYLGGDCHAAFHATKDTYKSVDDSSCGVMPADTKGMIVHFAIPEAMEESPVKNDEHSESSVESTFIDNVPADVPAIVPDEQTNEQTTTPPSSDDKQDKKHCNKGEGNGGEGCDPGNNPNKGNNDENSTTPEDKHSSLPLSFAGYVFVTFKKGKKEYHAVVSSWQYAKDGDLWLYVWARSNKKTGNCGYIKNARVIGSCHAESDNPHLGTDVEKIIHGWD